MKCSCTRQREIIKRVKLKLKSSYAILKLNRKQIIKISEGNEIFLSDEAIRTRKKVIILKTVVIK